MSISADLVRLPPQIGSRDRESVEALLAAAKKELMSNGPSRVLVGNREKGVYTVRLKLSGKAGEEIFLISRGEDGSLHLSLPGVPLGLGISLKIAESEEAELIERLEKVVQAQLRQIEESHPVFPPVVQPTKLGSREKKSVEALLAAAKKELMGQGPSRVLVGDREKEAYVVRFRLSGAKKKSFIVSREKDGLLHLSLQGVPLGLALSLKITKSEEAKVLKNLETAILAQSRQVGIYSYGVAPGELPRFTGTAAERKRAMHEAVQGGDNRGYYELANLQGPQTKPPKLGKHDSLSKVSRDLKRGNTTVDVLSQNFGDEVGARSYLFYLGNRPGIRFLFYSGSPGIEAHLSGGGKVLKLSRPYAMAVEETLKAAMR